MEPFRIERFNDCASASAYCTAVSLSSMSRTLRRLATFILLLTVPLRVYAAAVMVFCSPGSGPAAVESIVPAHHQMHASTHGHHADAEHFPSVHEASVAESHPQVGPDAAPFDDHSSCAGCSCSGMIATAAFDWNPQTFPTPAISSFIATAVPSTVPRRLERPPRTILA